MAAPPEPTTTTMTTMTTMTTTTTLNVALFLDHYEELQAVVRAMSK